MGDDAQHGHAAHRARAHPDHRREAKELRRVADWVVTFAKKGTLTARRRAAAVVRTDAMVQKLFTEFAERYRERAGGFTRVLQTGQRKSDSAKMAYIEYVDREGELRPARPAVGLAFVAAKEFVHRQMNERRVKENEAQRSGRTGMGGGGERVAGRAMTATRGAPDANAARSAPTNTIDYEGASRRSQSSAHYSVSNGGARDPPPARRAR